MRSALLVFVLFAVNASAQTSLRDCADCPEMISVPAGKFAMGSPGNEPGRDRDEEPVHDVAVKAFAAGKLEVTFRQWDACVADGGCKHQPGDEHWGREDRPVLNVSWADAKEYAQWLSKKAGKPYRLLTEAEWEYAARAGSSAAYYWGAGDASACDYAVVRSDWLGCGTGRDAVAGSRKPNAFGLYDMSGNVWEWTEDCYAETYAGAPADGRAVAGDSCTRRVTRGGAWDVRAKEARSANRNPRNAADRNYTIGFRVARDL
jgi:formylglycine-generating enzyme required for sulfatase activity